MTCQPAKMRFVNGSVFRTDAWLDTCGCSIIDHNGLRCPRASVEFSPDNGRMNVLDPAVKARTRTVHACVMPVNFLHVRGLAIVRQFACIGVEEKLVRVEAITV